MRYLSKLIKRKKDLGIKKRTDVTAMVTKIDKENVLTFIKRFELIKKREGKNKKIGCLPQEY